MRAHGREPGSARRVPGLMGKMCGAAATAVLAALALAGPAGAPGRAPGRLLKEYPIEQRAAPVASVPARPRARRAVVPPRRGAAPQLTQGAAIAIAAAAMLLAALVVTLRRRGDRVTASAGAAIADRPGDRVADAPRAAVVERPAVADPPTDAEPPAVAPDEPPGPPAPLPAEAGRNGVLCQIRWECDGELSGFAAVTTKGREHETIAESSEFAWTDVDPPPRRPDAQTALRRLTDDLAADGWQPVRGRGRQYGHPRWYARRFLVPAHGPEPRAPDEPKEPVEAGIR
jgi:hypothetical protein